MTDPTMLHNASPAAVQPPDEKVWGKRLSGPTRPAEIAMRSLWKIMDDIDTASDIIKPSDEQGYRKFYEYAMTQVARRHEVLESDGYDLFWPPPKAEMKPQ